VRLTISNKRFTTIVIAFQEEHACRDPYYLGINFDGEKNVFEGEFCRTHIDSLTDSQPLDWGCDPCPASGTVSRVLLDHVLDGSHRVEGLAGLLQQSLEQFPGQEGIAWLVWKEDLRRWTEFPNYGIIPRLGYVRLDEENKILSIKFPVPGVTFNQVGRS
jgi:hypothetical protein